MIPLVDLARQHAEIATELQAGWERVVETGAFVNGPQVTEFEEEFATFCEVAHCVGVASGTDALELALRALGIGRGDRVIVPANTFIASALAVVRTGAEVVLVDSDPSTHLIDVGRVEAAMDATIRAVMPVHLYGQMAVVEHLKEVVGNRWIIEDAAQAQGARRHGRRAGSLGVIAGTSFYPGKNIGAYGDAGAVLTSDPDLAHRVRALGNWGSLEKYQHPVQGFNSRLDTLQAVVLLAKLRRLETWNRLRAEAAAVYDRLLIDVDEVVRPLTIEGNEHVWHLYVVEVPNRDEVMRSMRAAGIGVGVPSPKPTHS